MTDVNPDDPVAESLAESFALMPVRADNARVIDPISPEEEEKRITVRGKIDRLEAALHGFIAAGGEEFDTHDEEYLEHYFIPGVYARELLIPGGSAVIGLLHKYERICIISAGECTFVTEFGTRRVQAPFTEVIPPGSKTAVYAHTDVVWTSIFRTDLTDPPTIVRTVTAQDHDEYHRFLEGS